MIRLDIKTSEGLAALCRTGGYDLRDVAALLWGLIMQVLAHKESISFDREIPGFGSLNIPFDTNNDASASDLLARLHADSTYHPLPEGHVFSDEAYNGIMDGYSDADGAYFIMQDDCLCMELKHCGSDELHGIEELFKVLAKEIVLHPNKPLDSLRRVSRSEEEKILIFSKGEELDYDKNMTWLDMFKSRVSKTPDALAIHASNGELTYKELDEASDRVASYILNRGVQAGSFIAVMIDRVKEYPVSVIGIHKARCAYVPIDIAYTKKRIDYMLKDSGALMTITEETVKEALKDAPSVLPDVFPDDTAYMIYTSGSTGTPKGAVIPHRGLNNLVLSMIKNLELTSDDRIGAYRSFSFDAHIEDFFPPLSVGASVYIMPEKIRRDPGEIAAYLNENKVTGCGFTTSVGKLLITGYDLNLRYLKCGGEALTDVTPGKVKIVNGYGPTEFTHNCTFYPLKSGVSYGAVPVGRMLPNIWCFVVDPFTNLVPIGIPGENCMAGIQVALGYHNRPDKTDEVFTDCPFVSGERMYKSGDLVRFNDDGNLVFVGRKDEQVKLNGYRIELGEIEASAGDYEGIEEVVALIKEVQGLRHLVLYYTVKDGFKVDEAGLRNHIETGIIPQYMYPEIYLRLDEMPRLLNGKIDRHNMPEPEFKLRIENKAPENALEVFVLDCAKKVLPGIDFGITDDLFALGLDSIGAMRFIALVNGGDYRTNYRTADIMRYRTVKKLIDGNRRVCFRHSAGHDPDKPVLVFVYGIAPVSGTLKMLDLWSREFNVYVIEPIDSHFKVLFDEPLYDEVQDMYLTLLENQIPGGVSRIDGFMGFSWGGLVSFTLASAIGKEGRKPFVLMGDTDFIERRKTEESLAKELMKYPDDLFEQTNGSITKIELETKVRLVVALNNSITSIPYYDGPVTMLDAAKVTDEDERVRRREKLDTIRQHAGNLRIVEFPSHAHNDLFYDTSLAEQYLEEMKRLMKQVTGK